MKKSYPQSDRELGKRVYVGLEDISVVCQECGTEATVDLEEYQMSDYICTGEADEIWVCCDNCGYERSVGTITLELIAELDLTESKEVK